jgi:hypothetical protein
MVAGDPFAHAANRAIKEVNLPSPLSIGVSLGGLLLDLIVPRPKPRAGYSPADSRTPAHVRLGRYAAAPTAGVSR